jgi:hypothetical protein
MAELKNEFSWSASREHMLRRCPRQYWFAYYGSWGGWNPRGDPRARMLYVLKQVKTRPLWAGDRVHGEIRRILEGVRAGTPPPSPDDATARLLEQMRADYRDSGEGLYWDDPKNHCALFEHEYEIELPDAAWKETVDRALECLRVFLRSDVFARLAGAPGQWLELEHLQRFDLEGTPVWVQLDFAFREEGGVAVYDWKTGRADTPATHEQLAVYALYAAAKWGVSADAVRCVEFNLARNECFEWRPDAAALESARARILASIGEMRAALDDPAANTASEARFPFAADEAECRRCGYLRACPKFQPES